MRYCRWSLILLRFYFFNNVLLFSIEVTSKWIWAFLLSRKAEDNFTCATTLRISVIRLYRIGWCSRISLSWSETIRRISSHQLSPNLNFWRLKFRRLLFIRDNYGKSNARICQRSLKKPTYFWYRMLCN